LKGTPSEKKYKKRCYKDPPSGLPSRECRREKRSGGVLRKRGARRCEVSGEEKETTDKLEVGFKSNAN